MNAYAWFTVWLGEDYGSFPLAFQICFFDASRYLSWEQPIVLTWVCIWTIANIRPLSLIFRNSRVIKYSVKTFSHALALHGLPNIWSPIVQTFFGLIHQWFSLTTMSGFLKKRLKHFLVDSLINIFSLLFFPFYAVVNSFWLMLSPSLSPEDLVIYMLATFF